MLPAPMLPEGDYWQDVDLTYPLLATGEHIQPVPCAVRFYGRALVPMKYNGHELDWRPERAVWVVNGRERGELLMPVAVGLVAIEHDDGPEGIERMIAEDASQEAERVFKLREGS